MKTLCGIPVRSRRSMQADYERRRISIFPVGISMTVNFYRNYLAMWTGGRKEDEHFRDQLQQADLEKSRENIPGGFSLFSRKREKIDLLFT